MCVVHAGRICPCGRNLVSVPAEDCRSLRLQDCFVQLERKVFAWKSSAKCRSERGSSGLCWNRSRFSRLRAPLLTQQRCLLVPDSFHQQLHGPPTSTRSCVLFRGGWVRACLIWDLEGGIGPLQNNFRRKWSGHSNRFHNPNRRLPDVSDSSRPLILLRRNRILLRTIRPRTSNGRNRQDEPRRKRIAADAA